MDRRRAGMVRGSLGILLALCCAAASAANAPGAAPANQFITLGTHGGPVSDRNRSQPANALVVGQQVYLVDAGDGAVQTHEVGRQVDKVRIVLVDELHQLLHKTQTGRGSKKQIDTRVCVLRDRSCVLTEET